MRYLQMNTLQNTNRISVLPSFSRPKLKLLSKCCVFKVCQYTLGKWRCKPFVIWKSFITSGPGAQVIKLEYSLTLKIQRDDWLLRTRVRKQPIITLYFEFENELKFYNLKAWSFLRILIVRSAVPFRPAASIAYTVHGTDAGKFS